MADSMGRRLFTGLSAISLALLVVSTVLSMVDDSTIERLQQSYAARSAAQQRVVQAALDRSIDFEPKHPNATADELKQMNALVRRASQAAAEQKRLSGIELSLAAHTSPFPRLMEISAVLPFAWLWWWYWLRERRKSRLEQNLCVKCGYDLRATPGRCPECGTESEMAVKAESSQVVRPESVN